MKSFWNFSPFVFFNLPAYYNRKIPFVKSFFKKNQNSSHFLRFRAFFSHFAARRRTFLQNGACVSAAFVI
jgi:hypothetical protein